MCNQVYIIIFVEQLLAFFILWRSVLRPYAEESPSRGARTFRFLLCAFLIAAAFMLRLQFFNYETDDYRWFLQKWVSFYRENGHFRALDRPVGNYNIPYLYFLALFSLSEIRDLYLIKLLSTLFDVVLAAASMGLARKCGAGRRACLFCFFIVLFLPTVVINSAVWAQCDSIYVSLALLGIYFALDEPRNGLSVSGGWKPVLSIVCIAASFGFKLQAVFIMPVFLILWFAKRLKWYHALVFPLTYFVMILPALIAGRPLSDAVMLYIDQADTVGTAMNYNAPSVFALIGNVSDPSKASSAGIVCAFASMGIILLLAYANRDHLNDRVILAFSLLMVTIIPFCLPHMHDRYFYAADIISVVFACTALEGIISAVCTQFASLICYLAYLKTYYLRLGSIFLTNDRGAWAIVISMVVCILTISRELERSRAAERRNARRAAGRGS